MVKNLLSLNVSSAVLLLNGSVGATHISVSHATKDKLMVTMSQNTLKLNYLSALELKPVP